MNINLKIDKEAFKKKLNVRDGIDGVRGYDGKDGINGVNGVNGTNGKDGIDGSPDTPEEVTRKVNVSETKIDAKQVQGLIHVMHEVDRIGTYPVGGGAKTVRYLDDGTEISAHVTELNFGTNLTGTYAGNGRVTINATGGSGGHTIQDEGVSLTARTNLNFVGVGVTVTDGGAGPDSTIVTIPTSSYTDEQAQDAVGAMVDASLTYVDATPLLQRAALTGAVTASAGSNTTALGSFTLAQLNTATSDADIARTDAANTFTGIQTFSTPIATTSVATMTATVGGGVPTPPNNTTTFLRGDGTFAVPPGGSGSFAVTETEVDFGTTPVTDKTFTVTDASITGTSKIMVTESGSIGTGRVASGDSLWDTISYSCVPAAGSFTLYARASGAVVGFRKLFYTYS
jgi:hypothetical protein